MEGWRSDGDEQLEGLTRGCEIWWDQKNGLELGQRMEQGWVNYGRFCARGAE